MRRRRTARSRWVWRAALIALAAVAVGLGLCVPRAGGWLVVEDAFDHAEVALVLSGHPISRALAARDLFQQGRVERIIVIPEPPMPFEEELVQLGLWDPTLPPWPERILVASGVPRDRLSALPEPADGTIAEARQTLAFLDGRMPSTLVLITSPFASRRARHIFRRALRRHPVTVLVYPTPYDPVLAERWWRYPRNALNVVMEYLKWPVALALTRDMSPRG
jgi:uncharacterized SAM-binding protein YcdF (DUF218 family)